MSVASSGINWCDATWNPIRGCSRVSAGCVNCYAESVAYRFSGPGQPYEGLARKVNGHAAWTGAVRFVEKDLDWPLRRRKPSRIFVNSMSDLFHERVTDEQIAAVFGTMAAARRHTFLVLTKRPERMRAWFDWIADEAARNAPADPANPWWPVLECAKRAPFRGESSVRAPFGGQSWPLPNVHIGVSVEDQATANERIPLLLETPAAVRWASAEPLLGPINLSRRLRAAATKEACSTGGCAKCQTLNWVVVGGESGPRARSCDVGWVRSIVEQCSDAGTPVWVKQLGARPEASSPSDCHDILSMRHRSGEEMSEWPDDLRVRELPGVAHG